MRREAGSAAEAVRAAGLDPVSRETERRLVRYVELLTTWSRVHNLVAPSTLNHVWHRHVADSAQLLTVAPTARRWLDLGSGAGFPGIVLAILLADDPNATVHLIESDHRRGAFLRTAADELSGRVTVHTERIEAVAAGIDSDAISARALASLTDLGSLLAPLVSPQRPAYLHKGAAFGEELAVARDRWTLDLVEHPSRIGAGVIAEVRSITARPPASGGRGAG